jgi:hypothetical protein
VSAPLPTLPGTTDPASLRRVSVVGLSASGKSNVSRRLATLLDIPYVELDELRFGPGWDVVEKSEFQAHVTEVAERDAWVVDGNFTSLTRHITWPRATAVVWVDPPRLTMLWRAASRTVRRLVTREELFHGNREQLGHLRDPDHPLRLALRDAGSRRERILTDIRAYAEKGGVVVRLRTAAETDRWLADVRRHLTDEGAR